MLPPKDDLSEFEWVTTKDLEELSVSLKEDGIPNVGELEEIDHYLQQKGLSSTEEKVGYLKHINPAKIDPPLIELGVTPANLKQVTDDFRSMQIALAGFRRTLDRYSGFQAALNGVNDVISQLRKRAGAEEQAFHTIDIAEPPDSTDVIRGIKTHSVSEAKDEFNQLQTDEIVSAIKALTEVSQTVLEVNKQTLEANQHSESHLGVLKEGSKWQLVASVVIIDLTAMGVAVALNSTVMGVAIVVVLTLLIVMVATINQRKRPNFQ